MLYIDKVFYISKKSKGFALPSVLIASLIMLIVLFASMSSVISVRSAIKQQYYNRLAVTAAEAGLNYAKACLEKNDYVPQWTIDRPLTVDSDCAGVHVDSFGSCPNSTNNNCYLVFDENYRAYFSVQIDNSTNKLASITSTGTLELLHNSDKNVWRKYTKTLRFNRTVIPRRSNLTSYYNSCSIGGNARVYCWGNNEFGQIGNGNVGTDVSFPELVKTNDDSELGEQAVYSISVGYTHACALAADSNVYCWGKNKYGQIGIGTDEDIISTPKKVHFGDKTIKSIDAGINFNCAIDFDNDVYCWGSQQYGELGDGYYTDNAFSLVKEPEKVQTTNKFQSISAGGHVACAIDLSNEIWCWGNNWLSQLGIGTEGGGSAIPVKVNTDSISDPNDKKFNFVNVGDGFHVCAINLNNKAYCWGYNTSGQLGTGDDFDRSVPTAVKSNDLGDALYNLKLISISTGGNHTCAVADNNKAYCWGNNVLRQLGLGGGIYQNKNSSNVPLPVDTSGVMKDKMIVGIGTADRHTCATDIDGYVYCWGDNKYGQLGIGLFGNTEPNTCPSNTCYLSPIKSYSPPSFEFMF